MAASRYGQDVPAQPKLEYTVIKRDGRCEPFDEALVTSTLERARCGITDVIDISLVLNELYRTIFDGIATSDLERGLILAATTFIERDPAYSTLASRLLRTKCIQKVTAFGRSIILHKQDMTVSSSFY